MDYGYPYDGQAGSRQDTGREHRGRTRRSYYENPPYEDSSASITSEELDRIIQTSGLERDRHIINCLCAKPGIPEALRDDLCQLMTEDGLRRLYEAGNPTGTLRYGICLTESNRREEQERGYRILEESFAREPSGLAAAMLVEREMHGANRPSEIVRYADPPVERFLRSGTPVSCLLEKEKTLLSAMILDLGYAYDSKPERLRESEPYKTHYEMIGKMEAELKRVNGMLENSGCMTVCLIFYLLLCGYALATNFRADGMLLGGPAGYIAILIVSFFSYGFISSIWSILVTAALIAGLGLGASLIRLNIGLNLSLLPLALLFLLALVMIVKDISIKISLRAQRPELKQAAETCRESLKRELKYCMDYCRERSALSREIQQATGEVALEILFQDLLDEELNHLREKAKELNIEV